MKAYGLKRNWNAIEDYGKTPRRSATKMLRRTARRTARKHANRNQEAG